MSEIKVNIKSVEGNRLSEESKGDSDVRFEVRASLTESERNPEFLALKFSIDLEAQPHVAKLSIAGIASVRGGAEEIEKLTSVTDGGEAPPIFMEIYKEVYATMYLLSGYLLIPYPAPGLLKINGVRIDKEMPPQPLQSGK